MKSITTGSLNRLLLLFVLGAPLAIADGRALKAANTTAACVAPIYHQFDFWVGEWDVFDVDSEDKVAHARIDSILGGCVLREDYQPKDGDEGQSFTIYDITRNVWHQTWVTSGGTLLEIEGTFGDSQVVLRGKNQKGEMVRGTWEPLNGEVRETAVRSSDAGRSWKPWFDIIFRRTKVANGENAHPRDDPRRDERTVAALDAEYQEAVKHNDATTMDRILSDDFILVTSSGRMYTKGQLIDEAKSGGIAYEHQEDTEKTVRLWGDTAVVTAKLWEKGTENGKAFDYKLWFSDVYRRTPTGWRYVFAQSAYRDDAE